MQTDVDQYVDLLVSKYIVQREPCDLDSNFIMSIDLSRINTVHLFIACFTSYFQPAIQCTIAVRKSVKLNGETALKSLHPDCSQGVENF